jgi:polysaccharide biosynthesis transport protein
MQAQNSLPSAAAESPGFGEYFGIIRKRRRLLLLVAGPIAALGALLAIGLPDVYRASGLIEIEEADSQRHNQNENLKSVIARDSDEPLYADQYVQSLSTIVLSDKSLARLLAQHQLYDDQKEDPAAALKELRSDIDVDIVTVPILDPETGREREVVTAFTVAYDNQDPQRAQQGAAWVVNAFMAENRRDRQQYAAGAAKFFGAEAERLRKRVGDLESKLAEFKAKNAGQLPELSQMNMGVMDRTENDIQNIESQMQALRRERVFLLAQLQQARATGPETGNLRALEEEYKRKSVQYDEGHPDMIAMRRQMDALRSGGSTTGQSLQAQLQTQRSILSEARQRYSEDHPDVKRIMRNIESLQARIAAGETADQSIASDSPMSMQLQTQLNATDTQLGALQARGAELRAKLSSLEGRMIAAPQVEREFQTVTRDLASARTKYEELLRRQMDAEVSEAAIAGGTADKFRVKSSPTTPDEPAKPKRIAIFAIAAVFGMIAALTSVVMAQLFDHTVRGVRDVREILDVAPLSAVPVIQRSKSGRARRRWSWNLRTAGSS